MCASNATLVHLQLEQWRKALESTQCLEHTCSSRLPISDTDRNLAGATAVSMHGSQGYVALQGADTPTRRVIAQERSSRSEITRSRGCPASSCTAILQCSGVAASMVTDPPGPHSLPAADRLTGRSRDRQEGAAWSRGAAMCAERRGEGQ